MARIGDSRKTVAGYFNWFRARGLTSRSNPRPGDLIVWGDTKHIGIYVGDGKAGGRSGVLFFQATSSPTPSRAAASARLVLPRILD